MQDILKVSSWVVTAPEKALFDQIFEALDIDMDGFIVGTDQGVKEMFIKTGLSHTILAMIWGLCDIKQNGKLNSEQFALAMHFVNEVKKGHELPRTLTPEMVPPTLRPKPVSGSESISSLTSASSGTLESKFTEPSQFSSKELEDLAAELRELQKEMNQLEQEVMQQETQQKLKESEVKSLQNEYETLNQMLKQLENQKVEANRRLAEMDNQKIQLKQQMEEQKTKMEEEESQLNAKKQEFNALHSEEEQLESKLESGRLEIDEISKQIANCQLQCAQIDSKLISLKAFEDDLNKNTADLDIAIAAKDIHKLNQLLSNPVRVPDDLRKHFKASMLESDPFADNSDFPSLSSHFAKDPFAGEDPFNEANAFSNEADPFAKKDPFFQPSGEDFFANDSFSAAFSKPSESPFQSTTIEDPFAPKPVTSPSDAFRSQGSTPELPPKNSKVPPPRPAPPKQNKPAGRPAAADPWTGEAFDSNSNAGNSEFDAFGGNFANFANFDQVQ